MGDEFKIKYGKRWHATASNLDIELACWRDYVKLKKPELERWQHLRNVALMAVPDLKKTYNEWFERCIKAYAGYEYIAALGCKNSGKTHTFHTLAYLDFLSEPYNTQVICTTTSAKGLSERAWPILSALYSAHRPDGWVMKSSPRMIIQSDKNDPKHAVRLTPVQQRANESEMIDNLIGAHTKRVIMLNDEATSVPPAVLSAWSNLMGGTEHRRLVQLGNPDDPLDTLGTFSTPVGGWDSVDVETETWEFSYMGKPGIGLHFDGLKSPNMSFPPDALGRSKFNFLFGHEDARAHADKATYAHWRFCRGWFVDNSIVPKVITMAEIDEHHCRDGVVFQGVTEPFAALDPAFGGDRPILKIFNKGVDADTGKPVMLQVATFEVPLPPKQLPGKTIGEFVMAKAATHHFKTIGIDTTTDNSAVAEYLKLNSTLTVMDVTFGGAPSDDPVSPTDKTPCKDKYDRRVTELWFNVKQALPQLRGLDVETCKELCSRYFERVGKPEKLKVETKQEMKRRAKGRSPDLGDCAAIGVLVFKKLGGFELPSARRGANEWKRVAKKRNAYWNQEYAYTD